MEGLLREAIEAVTQATAEAGGRCRGYSFRRERGYGRGAQRGGGGGLHGYVYRSENWDAFWQGE